MMQCVKFGAANNQVLLFGGTALFSRGSAFQYLGKNRFVNTPQPVETRLTAQSCIYWDSFAPVNISQLRECRARKEKYGKEGEGNVNTANN